MAKKKDYTSEDIQILTDREHVRKRTQIYLGNMHSTAYTVPLFIDDKIIIDEVTFVPAVYKAVGEIIDNSIDEFAQITQTNKVITIDAEPEYGKYDISDNGRGIPITKHASGKYTPEVAIGSLRAGRNFSNEKDTGVIGQNGVGSACTNYCSTDFEVIVDRDNKRYKQKFTDGAEKISRPTIRGRPSKNTGTNIKFTLDPSVFEDTSLPDVLMKNRAIEIAFTNPNTTVKYNGEKFKYKKGLEDIVKNLTKKNGNYFKFEYQKNNNNLEFYFVDGVNTTDEDNIFTWVNSSLLFDGGICNTQFMNAFIDKTINHLAGAAKKQKCKVTKEDVKPGLLMLGNLKLTNPEYDAQSKTRLTGPNLRKEMGDMISDMWASFARKNKSWFEAVLERAVDRHHFSANKKAINNHKKNLRKKVPGLVDATSKNRFECQVLITEGDSAASMIDDARNTKTTASMPLMGKVNNVYGTTPAQILAMGKLTNLLSAIGLIPGQKAVRSELRYGKIVVATDSDVDGDDIFTLLINLFYTHWPELFDKDYDPIIYRLVAPNVCLVKGKTRIHFSNRNEYEKDKHKYKGYEVKYFKGLGSMSFVDWEMILSEKTDSLIPVVDDGKIEDTLELLFGSNTDARKKWLT